MNESNELLSLLCFNPLDINTILSIGYHLNLTELIIIGLASILMAVIFHGSFKNYSIVPIEEAESDTIPLKQYTIGTKMITSFIILVVISMPLFKLLNGFYFK
jgi:hypothetical protein